MDQHGPSGRLSGEHGPSGRLSGEHGQATPLLAIIVLAIGGFTLALARFGADATHVARAQAAADAAALAGAAEGEDGAEEVATANGGVVERYQAHGREVELRVMVGRASAVARAVRIGGGGGVTGWVGVESAGGSARNLDARMRAALDAAAELLHQPVPITSARGTEVIVPPPFVARLAAVAERAGLCRPSPRTDPVRFGLCRADRG